VLYAYVQGVSIFKIKFNSKETRNVNGECNLIIFIHVSRPDCSTESTRINVLKETTLQDALT
jgi:hypothetical protein